MTYRIFISYSQDDFLARSRKLRNYLAKVIPDSYVYIDQDKEKGTPPPTEERKADEPSSGEVDYWMKEFGFEE